MNHFTTLLTLCMMSLTTIAQENPVYFPAHQLTPQLCHEAMNYRDSSYTIELPAESEIIIGNKEIPTAGVLVWKTK